MTSLRGLWKDCEEWDRRYQTEIDRTNKGSETGRFSQVDRCVPGAASTAPAPADVSCLAKERTST